MFNRIIFLIQLLYFLFMPCNSAIDDVSKDDPDSIVWCPVGSYISSMQYSHSDGFYLLSASCYNSATQQSYDLNLNTKDCKDHHFDHNHHSCVLAYGFQVQRSKEKGSIKKFLPGCGAPFDFQDDRDIEDKPFGRSGRCPYNLAACGIKTIRKNKRDCTTNLTHFSFACCEVKP